jgi:uncharacterized protein (TIGR03437 family)
VTKVSFICLLGLTLTGASALAQTSPGAGISGVLSHPYEAIEDSSGAIYIADAGNNRILKISNGTLGLVAGGNASGAFSGDNGPPSSASLNDPQAIVFDRQGNLYISDTNNNRIRKITSAGIIVTVAGTGVAAFSGDGGAAANAAIHYPAGLATDTLGNLYFADLLNQRIREITPQGVISTVAGNGTAGYGGDGGLATNAALQNPEGVSVDQAGNLYIADNYNNRIRKVSASTGIITTVVGTGVGGYNGDGISATLANIYGPPRVTVVPNGDLYIADSGNQRVRRVDAQTQLISTIAGDGYAGFAGDGGPATQAEVNIPHSVYLDAEGRLLFAEYANNVVRAVAPNGIISTVLGNVTPPGPSEPGQPTSTVMYQGFSGASNNIPVTYNLYPWFGKKVALLTPLNTLDVPTMNTILAGLDAAWAVYEQITGADPSPYPPGTLNGRDIIAVVPDASIPSCAACTYVGANGSELTSTWFDVLYNGVMDNGQFDQVMFYEFGRNFWFYTNQLGQVGQFITGFAIANRFISMDSAGLNGGPFNGLTFAQFQTSDMIDFLNSYLADPNFTWENTILTGQAPPSAAGWSAADLAGAMFYRLYDDFGFAAYQAFWRALQQLPTAPTPDGAIQNFLAAAMTATGRNYGFLFKGAYDAPSVDLCSLTPASSAMSLGAQAASGSLAFTTSRDYCTWTAAVSGGSWLHLAVGSGTGSGALSFSVDANTTGQSRQAAIALGGASISVVQTATPSVVPSVASVVNGASLQAGAAPGGWVTIEGQSLALSTQTAAFPLPQVLGGVQVLVDGNPIPLYYVSPTQINGQLPYETAGGPAQLVVINYSAASTPAAFSVSATSPGIFASGGRAVAQNVDASSGAVTLNSPSNPVSPGGYLVLYLTGQGALNNPIPTGAAAPASPFSSPVASFTVRIGGIDAPVLFLGMTPGLVGVAQANVQVPAGLAAEDQPAVVSIGGMDSPPALVSVGH